MWKNKEGKAVAVSAMSDLYLINSIKWLVNDSLFGQLTKDGRTDTEWVIILAKELSYRSKI